MFNQFYLFAPHNLMNDPKLLCLVVSFKIVLIFKVALPSLITALYWVLTKF